MVKTIGVQALSVVPHRHLCQGASVHMVLLKVKIPPNPAPAGLLVMELEMHTHQTQLGSAS